MKLARYYTLLGVRIAIEERVLAGMIGQLRWMPADEIHCSQSAQSLSPLDGSEEMCECSEYNMP